MEELTPVGTCPQVILETFSRFRDSRARRAELERAAAAWASKHRDPGGRETGDEDRDRPGSPKAAVYWWDQPGCDPGKRRPEGLDRRPVACDQQRSYWWDDPGEEGWETPPEARKAAEGSRCFHSPPELWCQGGARG